MSRWAAVLRSLRTSAITGPNAPASPGYTGSMPIRDSLLAELDRENAATRRVLERAPEAKFDWQPHPKSMSLGRLAAHIAELAGFGAAVVRLPEMDVSARDYQPLVLPSSREVLALFDANAAKTRAAVAAAPEQAWPQVWTLREGEKIYFQLPRDAAVRTLVIKHTVHHRAQLGVYLRLNEVPVPRIYGPSADEPV